jgi:hypothetical protein
MLLYSYLKKNNLLNIDENIKHLLDFVPFNNDTPPTSSDQLVNFYLGMAQQIKDFNNPPGIRSFDLIDFLCNDLIQLCDNYKFFTERTSSQSGTSYYQTLLDTIRINLPHVSQSYHDFTIKKDNVKLYVVADYCVQQKNIFGGRPQKSRKFTLKNKNQNKKTYNKKTHNKKIRSKTNKTRCKKKFIKKNTNTLRKL